MSKLASFVFHSQWLQLLKNLRVPSILKEYVWAVKMSSQMQILLLTQAQNMAFGETPKVFSQASVHAWQVHSIVWGLLDILNSESLDV